MYSNVNAMGCYPVAGKITKEDVGLGNVDNTSDLDKPISNAMREIVDRMEQAVTDVNEAVETANEASESAQESAETVAGYNTRLTDAENGVSLNRSNITTLDGEMTGVQQDVQILYDRDANDVKLDGNQTITGSMAFEITTDRYITARRNNPNFNARAISTDKSTNRHDLFATLHYDVNSQEVVRDYTAIGKDYIISEKWASFGDDDGVIHHPQIGVRTNSDGTSYTYVGGYSGTLPSNTVVYKGMMETTDGVTNNLVHTISDEVIRGIKTHTTHINYSQGNLATPGNYVFAQITGTDNNTLGKLMVQIQENGRTALIAQVRNANGTFKFVNLATGDN